MGTQSLKLSLSSESAVGETIAAAALKAEHAICIARILFFGALLARFLGITLLTPVQTLVTAIPLGIGIIFSVYVLLAVRTPPKREVLWIVSASLDAVICFFALLPNALWPSSWYTGIVNLPDTVGLFIATIGAGFRLSRSAAIWGGATNLAGLIALLGVDRIVSGDQFVTNQARASLYIIYVAGFAALAIILAVTTRRLVRRGAVAALRADLLSEHDKLKSRFFANVSHELRTPLTLILTPLQQILAHKSEGLSESFKDRLRSMQGNAQRLLRLVNQLLDFSAIESGRADVRFEWRDLKGLVEPIVNGFRSFARAKDLKLELRGPADLPEAYVDPEKLDKVLCNLLSNACKFTDPGGAVVVRLGVDDPYLQIAVKDTGHGIAEADLPKVFERFLQLDDVASRKHQGSGIGLSLAKELVELMGGKLEVESELSVGSTFTVSLRLGTDHINDSSLIRVAAGEESEAAAKSAAAALAAESGQIPLQVVATGKKETIGGPTPVVGGQDDRPLVLVVEDNPDMRSLVAEICQDEFRVLEAADGQQGLDLVREHRPSLVISDVMMPGIDGNELLRQVRLDEQTATIPVMLLTARAGSELKLEGLESGADDYLIKPFESRELLARARNLVRLQQQERQLKELNTRLQQEVVSQASRLERARKLKRYLSPEVARSVLEEGLAVEVGQQRQRLTVFRIELRGFDELVEMLEPEDMAAMLNGYLSEMTDLAFRHGATLDKLVRDTVVGFFGAPGSEGPEQDALRCAKMAVEMFDRAAMVCDRWQEILESRPPSPTLVLTSGHATVGNFGSSNRLEYTAVGGPVDEASALLSTVGPGELVCSATTWSYLKGEIDAEPCGEAVVRGRSRPTKLYRLAGPLERSAPEDPSPAPAATGSLAPTEGRAIDGELKPGLVLAGRYETVRRLGEGGMGIVYQVRDLKLSIDVALKLVRHDSKVDPAGLARLQREVKLARLVSHPNVGRIYDIGEWEGHEFISMEYIQGETLDLRLKTGGPLPSSEGREVLQQLCAGLAAAHTAGVVHRDLKPANIMLERGGRVVILDFGLAQWAAGQHLTGETRSMMGTPHYMAPEQFEGETVDQRTDIYALGVVAFEIFTGNRPFEADSPVALALKHTEKPPPDPLTLKPNLPPRLTAVILRCLEKSPRNRFSSVDEIASLLAES